MFSKKKKKPQISLPSNFEHRVHTGFDKREGRYVGLPKQWASIVGNNQILRSTNRPLPLIDPSEITPTEILDLKTIVRPHHNNNKPNDNDTSSMVNNSINLPKTSHVARSNSLRSSSPPRARRDLLGSANVPPSVPEESGQSSQFSSLRRDQGANNYKYPSGVQQPHQQIPQNPYNEGMRKKMPPMVPGDQIENQPMYQNNNAVVNGNMAMKPPMELPGQPNLTGNGHPYPAKKPQFPLQPHQQHHIHPTEPFHQHQLPTGQHQYPIPQNSHPHPTTGHQQHMIPNQQQMPQRPILPPGQFGDTNENSTHFDSQQLPHHNHHSAMKPNSRASSSSGGNNSQTTQSIGTGTGQGAGQLNQNQANVRQEQRLTHEQVH